MMGLRNLRVLYAVRFFGSLIPAYVIERLFWEERGMTIQMVVYTEIIFAVTVVLLELPAGIIADRRSRKRMLVLASLLGCFEFLILVYATSFWHFALAVFLAAVGRSAGSGAENALLYDSLQEAGREKSFEQVLGRLNAVDITSTMLAAMCGSFLAGLCGYELNYWISLASSLAALCFTFMLVGPAASGGAEGEKSIPIGASIAGAVRFFKRNRRVMPVMLSGMVTGASLNFIDEFWQLYLDRIGIPAAAFGLFSASIFLLRLPGNLLAYKLKTRMGSGPLLTAVTAVLAAGFLYLSMARNVSGLAAIFLICLAGGVIEPLAAGYLHHRIDSSMRATMDSFQSLGLNAALIAIGLGFGYFSSRWDVFGGYGFVGLLCLAFCVYFAFASSKL
ncbi:MFS transporter [Paenibacillus rhizophilus]|uniref:MFS transporter n=1 Tax=Paenibacillus rhizophilus TaxID=1850366 RepID=A0A3N9NWG3_9BACL|nr:MFS transporter [Paenibacillus rhizophilus]RQW08095.1 MFS transporter [Paenibacillus rhizophilus]